MNKKQLYKRIAERLNKNLCNVDYITDAVIDEIAKSISHGEPITFNGVFTIRPIKRKARLANNFKKKEKIVVPEHYVPHAVFSERMVYLLNKNLEKEQKT